MILLIDNYDSFVYNLARYINELEHETKVIRNDAVTIEDIQSLAPSHIIISPGPKTPAEAGISNEVIRKLGSNIPILGVCLGHQCIGHVFGGDIAQAQRPMHGKTSQIEHDGRGIFSTLPQHFKATRYHSLVIKEDTLPDDLVPTAYSPDGEIMALRHKIFPIVGVQFHPESVLTEHGHTLLENFLKKQ